MRADGALPAVDAGLYPPALLQACALYGVHPHSLLGWSVRQDGVWLVLPDGRKVAAEIRGDWQVEGAAKTARPARKGR